MKKISVFLVIMLAVLSQGIFAADNGTTKRFGLFIGANNGGQGRQTLRYAVSDARAVSKVFLEMGGIETQDATLLVEPTIREIDQKIDAINRQINTAKNTYKRTELVFYYSGHSDEDGLLLNQERYNYRELRERINGLPSDMRIIILDSCSSGAITRAKGGVKTKPFMIDDANTVEGYAFLTSSSADEVSQESDLIESSYFTHSLLAGLRGAAETVGDRRITLNELYGFAYTETLAKTETSRYGAQHPNYDMQISGTGDVILTDLSETSASLVLGEDIIGRISIRDSSDYLIAEVTKANAKAMELGLEAGVYQLTIQQGDRFFRTTVTLTEDARTPIAMGNFTQINASPAVPRGGEAAPAPEGNGLTDDDRRLLEEARRLMNESKAESSAAEIAAAPVKAEEKIRVEPFHFEFIQDDWFGKSLQKTTNNVLLGFVSADGYNLEGIGAAIVGVVNTGYVHGIQVSTVYNIANSLKGVQVSSALNFVTGSFDGFQVGLVNIAGKDIKGFQAGLINWASGSVDGFQASLVNIAGRGGKGSQYGLINWAHASLQGAQGGLVNISRSDSSGLQAGLVNITGTSFRGLQAGLVNISGAEGKNAQFGLVNISRNPNVFSLGLLNFVKDGIFHPAFFMDDMMFANVSLRTGSKKIYSIFITGFKHFSTTSADESWTDFDDVNGETYITSRFGLGGEVALGPIFLNLDLTVGNIYNLDSNFESLVAGVDLGTTNTLMAQARFTLGFELFEHLGAFVGVSYDYFHRWNGHSPVPKSIMSDLTWSDEYNIHRIGLFAGIQF